MSTGFDVIYAYTRRQAIEDGVLVQLSGPGYVGDPWIPEMVAEAGLRYPVAMTATAFAAVVAPIAGDGMTLAPCQDIKGRLWDVLHMLTAAIRRGSGGTVLLFELRVVPNVSDSYAKDRPPRAKRVELKLVCGPGDQAEPVLTIMFPHED